ncbi:hypothetical protein LS70_000795 [Helicobacter sp. MIT 11-5569]|uniref:tetratricopeptide repeat protein n=1 Tax=Helicobacter sp. MIT 11-5569 TaxID=1548151 RepID=UPI00051FAD93|nr:hypothetical protein [Helicobacter sp. MIT 11-5569]TLD85123.1 hypothetical protein LS70_000795 [Helicobacter sp. MIT 11-5569]
MQKLFASSLVVASLVFAQEPSAFNAGGTMPQKTELQIINERLFNLSTQVKSIEESQEGLKSVFEGQIQRVQDVAGKIELLKGENNATITEIRKHTDSNFALQNENIEKIKQSISSLGALIKKTNAQMQEEINALKEKIVALESSQSAKSQNIPANSTLSLTRETNATSNETNVAINALIANVENNATQIKVEQPSLNAKSIEELPLEKSEETENAQKIVEQTTLSQQNNDANAENKKENNNKENQKVDSKNSSQTKKETQKTSDLKKKPLANVFQEGEQFYKDKNYGLADEYLQFAVKGNYKPARGNYLLGEIAFEQKRYEDAIYYYKTSATRYDKADYMPRLMLNSAKSFLSLKENEHANRFLETLITLYPKSNEAKEAKKLIK